MSAQAIQINDMYLEEMQSAPAASVLGRLRDLWWPTFLEKHSTNGAEATLDTLDLCMDDHRKRLQQLAFDYAASKGFEIATPQYNQAAMQFLKSNTGKMFERFVGLAIAHSLKNASADYCILPFRSDMLRHCHGATKQHFEVVLLLGGEPLKTPIDADLIAFNPTNPDADIYMISIKSTLKDRFHNVPFWNLLRIAAIHGALPNLSASNSIFLSKMKYIAICTDLAEQQPDFSAEAGPRNLLKYDAALLDGAYVTASRARGLGSGENHLGLERQAAFFPLHRFFRHITSMPQN